MYRDSQYERDDASQSFVVDSGVVDKGDSHVSLIY